MPRTALTINRRKFLKRGLLFVPAPFAILIAKAQSLNLADGPFIAAPPSSLIPFITVTSLGTARTDITGILGFQITAAGSGSFVIRQLGRMVMSGNSGSHNVCLNVNGSNQGSVTVNTSGKTVGQFAYVALGSPVTVSANQTVSIESSETSGADGWLNNDSTFTNQTSILAANSPAWPHPAFLVGGAACANMTIVNQTSFYSVNFLYTLT